MGQTIFTCQFLCIHESLYSTIWTRLALKDHSYKKKQRKLMRRNAERFTYKIGKANLDVWKEFLYQKYRDSFDGYLSPSLLQSLQDNSEENIYDTYEIAIYDGEQLIGFSFFDLGVKSIASIMGVYDPDYKQHSLGYYTMLLEMQYGIEHDFDYYYPGYVVPDYAKFDYKLRIGDVEYFEPKTRQWLPYTTFDYNQVPIQVLKSKLVEIQDFLNRLQISNQKSMYPLYEANMLGYWQENFLEHPLFLMCFPEEKDDYHYHVLTYDLMKEKYLVYQCAESEELSLIFKPNPDYTPTNQEFSTVLDLLIKKKLIIESTSLVEVAKAILPYRADLF